VHDAQDQLIEGLRMGLIHPTALIDPAAELDSTVAVGAYSIVGPHVRVGAGTVIGPHCVVEGRTTIGEQNHFFQFSSIGAVSQDMSYAGEPTQLVIGDRNTVREFCTLNLGTMKEEGITRIGSDNWIMAYVHIAHDVRLGDHTVLANNATLAGHVHVGDWAVIGFQGHVSQDVPPFMTVDGNPLTARAVNLTGLRRRGFSDDRIRVVRQMHKLLYRSGLTLEQSVSAIAALSAEVPEAAGDVQVMLDFIASAKRGIVR
jgi:UDP-N-acetylglucosamine acyltransferase